MDHRQSRVRARPRRPLPRGLPDLSDAVVIGAGICGAACALELAERGARVVLIDRGEVSGESTGLGEGNVLLSDKRPGPEMALAKAGRRLWDELDARFPNATRVQRKGALVLFDREGAAEFAAALAAQGIGCEVIEDPARIEPALTLGLPPAVLVPGELQVDARGLTRALVAEATRLGVDVREHTAVDRLGRTGAVVLAAGAWSAALAATAGLHLPVEPRKGTLVALAAPAGTIGHKLYEASYLDTIESASEGLQIAAVVEQTLDGDEVLVGSSRERVGFDTTVSADVTRALRARAARFVPALAELEPSRAWAGLRPWLPDGLPAVGRSRTGIHVCTGHEGAGIALGPISGRIVAQLIAGEPPTIDPAPFDPDRFG